MAASPVAPLRAKKGRGKSKSAACPSAGVGGAAVFDFSGRSILGIGSRNVDAAYEMLKE